VFVKAVARNQNYHFMFTLKISQFIQFSVTFLNSVKINWSRCVPCGGKWKGNFSSFLSVLVSFVLQQFFIFYIVPALYFLPDVFQYLCDPCSGSSHRALNFKLKY
jgi:hypothetical protein